MYWDILQLFAEVWVAKFHLNMYKIAHNVSLDIQKNEEKNLLFAFEKEVFISYNFDKFWPNPKFWLYFDL